LQCGAPARGHEAALPAQLDNPTRDTDLIGRRNSSSCRPLLDALDAPARRHITARELVRFVA